MYPGALGRAGTELMMPALAVGAPGPGRGATRPFGKIKSISPNGPAVSLPPPGACSRPAVGQEAGGSDIRASAVLAALRT